MSFFQFTWWQNLPVCRWQFTDNEFREFAQIHHRTYNRTCNYVLKCYVWTWLTMSVHDIGPFSRVFQWDTHLSGQIGLWMVKMVTLGVLGSNYSDVMSGITRHYKGGYHNLLYTECSGNKTRLRFYKSAISHWPFVNIQYLNWFWKAKYWEKKIISAKNNR